MILAETEDEEIKDMTTTMVEWWRRQGREQGLEQGRTEGQRDLVLRLLNERFGSLSTDVRRRVSAIDSVNELTRLATRTLTVKSLKELGLT